MRLSICPGLPKLRHRNRSSGRQAGCKRSGRSVRRRKGLESGDGKTKQFFLRSPVCNVIYYVANRAIKVNSAVLSLFPLPLSLVLVHAFSVALSFPRCVLANFFRGISRANCLAPSNTCRSPFGEPRSIINVALFPC